MIGLTVKYILGDGNCMFRAIADQLSGQADDHMEYRRQIMDFIGSRKDYFSLFIEDESIDDYIDRMRYGARILVLLKLS